MAKYALTLESDDYDYIIHISTIAELLHNDDPPALFCIRWTTEMLFDSLHYAIRRMVEDGYVELEEVDSIVYHLRKCAEDITEIVEKTKVAYPRENEDA